MSDATASPDVLVRDDSGAGEYVVAFGGVHAGKAEYRDIDGRRVFTHTEVDDEFSGKGLATKLVRFALEDVKGRGVTIVPLCPFFAAYIKRHPEYEELVDHQMTMELKKRS